MSIGEIVIIAILIGEWVYVTWRSHRAEAIRRRRVERLASVTREQWQAAVAQVKAAQGEDRGQTVS